MIAFQIVRDARGSLVHVRHATTGERIGDIEDRVLEIPRMVVLTENEGARGATSGAKVSTERHPGDEGSRSSSDE